MYKATAILKDSRRVEIAAMTTRKALQVWIDQWLASGWSGQVREIITTQYSIVRNPVGGVNQGMATGEKIINRCQIAWQ